MKILITGSNGFIGSNLAEVLGKKNDIIGTGTRAESFSHVDAYFQWNMAEEECPYEKIPGDIDIVIHAAACLDKDNMNEQVVATNCMGTYRVYQLARKLKVKTCFNLSSVPVIGVPKEHPITEKHPLNPLTMYHVTKLTSEYLLNQLLQEGIQVVNLRVPSPIAPGMPVKTILPIFMKQAVNVENIKIAGNGTRKQNYIDVRDIAYLIEQCLDKENISGTYCVGSTQVVSNYELAKLCVEVAESASEIVFTGVEDLLEGQVWDIDTSYAYEKLGFQQKYDIRESLKDIMLQMKKER